MDNFAFPLFLYYYADKEICLLTDLGSNNSGYYQLQAVLTHQGRTSSSGHYVAWVRFRNKEWLKCDDDEITAVTEEEITKLSGGGKSIWKMKTRNTRRFLDIDFNPGF